MASRAHLLAGLRTGGPRSSSPFEGDRFEQEQASPRATNAAPAANSTALKANAAPFTPSKRLSAGPAAKGGADEQAAALRIQQAILAASHRQASHSQGEDFAALYGASQGQPQQQDIANLIRQKQAQLLQNQLLAQQQQQQQQQYLQHVAAQQRLLQLQAEYNQQQYSAQASIQASMRQRQAEQMYAQLMEQQQQQEYGGEDAQMQQQQQLLQRLHLLQLQAAAMQGMQDLSFGEDSPQAMSTPRRNASPRNDSPSVAQQNRRDRQASQTAADNAISWRSTPTSLSKATAVKVNAGRKTPSIVVDDSGSDKSEDGTSVCEDIETPETSEEDVSALAKEVGQRLSVEKRETSPASVPRPLALSQAPRNRAFSADIKTNIAANGGAGINVASRQPKGPPTEFLSINFTSRLSARTRREAMSKLCASPRAASFNMVSRPAVVA